MKKLTFLTLTLLFIQTIIFSQPCLPEGITFSSQEQIDNFQINYPNCDKIEGDVNVYGDDITNVNGLDVLTSIGGELSIENNDSLINLLGLENVTLIGGDLNIWSNNTLTNLFGLGNLTSVGGISIHGNNLTTFTGLNNLTSVGSGGIVIQEGGLTTLSGLENITTIEGTLAIGGPWGSNTFLTSLSGLDNVASIGGHILISNLDALTNMTGLNSLTSIGGSVSLRSNDALIDMAGLENLLSIEGSLLIGDYYYWSMGNSSLVSLSGLNNLTTIGGDLEIRYNESLISLNGLDNVTSIGGDLAIQVNGSLNNLIGIGNLTSVNGGTINIVSNSALTSLDGLDNIDTASIVILSIINNNSLTNCAVKSVCDHLADPNGYAGIYDNAPGCNSPEEVQEACEATAFEEIIISDHIKIKPNPFSTLITIEFVLDQAGKTDIKIYNQLGQLVEEFIQQNGQTEIKQIIWNANDQLPGIYFIRLQVGAEILSKKIIKL